MVQLYFEFDVFYIDSLIKFCGQGVVLEGLLKVVIENLLKMIDNVKLVYKIIDFFK